MLIHSIYLLLHFLSFFFTSAGGQEDLQDSIGRANLICRSNLNAKAYQTPLIKKPADRSRCDNMNPARTHGDQTVAFLLLFHFGKQVTVRSCSRGCLGQFVLAPENIKINMCANYQGNIVPQPLFAEQSFKDSLSLMYLSGLFES